MIHTPLMFTTNSRQLGVTLLEIMTVVAIIGIVTSIAIPSFINILHKWEANQIKDAIISAYKVGKLTSYTHHNDIVLCAVNSDDVCNKAGQDSILIFKDSNKNRQFDIATDTLIEKMTLNLDYGRIHLRVSRGAHYIKFFGDSGLPRGHYGHFRYCPHNGNTNNMYQVSINKFGGYRFKPNHLKPTECP